MFNVKWLFATKIIHSKQAQNWLPIYFGNFPKKHLESPIPPQGRHQWKKTFSLGHCPNHLPAPPTPIWATWSFFFGSQNSRFESQFRTKNTIYTIWYTVYMQLKKELYWHFWRNILFLAVQDSSIGDLVTHWLTH